MTRKPLLALVMIVKNEARSIRETINSVKPHIDRYTIVDTGSTDGTQAIVQEAFEGLPGELIEEPFVDFSTTRNRALELAGNKSIFTLMLSGDETLINSKMLRCWCQGVQNETSPHHETYHVRVQLGTATYDSPRLTRASAGWRYVGITHEILTKENTPPPTLRVPHVSIFHNASQRNIEHQRQRWELDLKLLTAEEKKKPDDTRTTFYLAQTLECLGETWKAQCAYARRIKMGGWEEEVYESLFRYARLNAALERPWFETQQRYLDAYAHSPHRAEPLFAIAWYWYEQKNWPLAYMFTTLAYEIPFPEKSTLFVDAEMYRSRLPDLMGIVAYYVGEYTIGKEAVEQALIARPDDPRLIKNLSFYLEKLC